MASATTTLLCAARFLAHGAPGAGGFRAFTRKIARQQGHSPAALDKAERSLIKRGLLARGGGKIHPTVLLTVKGATVSKRACPAVSLSPWKAREFGRARRRR